MREDIKNILGTYITRCVCERDDYHIPNDELVDYAARQILSLIAKSLPEKKLEDCSCFACSTNNEDCYCHSRVYNQMLAEVKKRMGVE